MMSSVLGGHHQIGALPVQYPHDPMLEELSRQMSLVQQNSRRLSRGSNGQRSGSAMRVAKPSSTSNSPRSSAVMARRKTLVNDGNTYRYRQQMMDQTSLYTGMESQPVKRSTRPVSWHPSSYTQPTQSQFPPTSYPLSTPNLYADQQETYATYPHFSPMMGASSNTSPSSFSNLPLPYHLPEPAGYVQPQARPESMATRETSTDEVPYIHGLDWNAFVMHGFNSTSPPTPEAFPQVQLSKPAVSEEAIPYQALEESTEEEGEILIGMGLYDTPDKSEEDPQLNNYRSTVSSLLGSTFRAPEPMGKGLKLEETWEPPKSDDEEEDDDEE